MPLEFIAAEVLGAITVKTVPVVVDFLSDRIRKILATKRGKGKKELESLRKEVQDFKKRIDSKEQVETSDIRQVEANIKRILLLQRQYDLELLSDEAHRKWLLSQFDELSELKQLERNFEINVWTEKGTSSAQRDISIVPKISHRGYKIGDKITVFFRSGRDCYLHLFNLGTSGRVTVLFPNQLSQDNLINAGETYAIPGEGYPFEYEITGPSGIERIKAIATTTHIDLVDLDFSGQEGVFHATERSAAARDVKVVEKRVRELPLTGWAETMCQFIVE